MKRYLLPGAVLILGILVSLYVVFVRPFVRQNVHPVLKNQKNVPAQQAADLKKTTSTQIVAHAPIPQGAQTYRIMQAADTLPRIVQATVNPVDVHVGDIQKLMVIVSDPDAVTSVEAKFQTDHKTITIPLKLAGPAAVAELTPQKYFVDQTGTLVFSKPKNEKNIAYASENNMKYEAEWKVEDTHVAQYYTVFTAKDEKGRQNSARIGWTDAECSWGNNYGGGTWQLSANFGSGCELTSTDGVENGNVLIDSTMTLQPGSVFIFNPGKQITFSGAGVLVLAGSPRPQIVKSEIYGVDADGDGYAGGWTTNPAGATVRYLVAGSGDCNDSNANVHPGQTAFFPSPDSRNSFDYNCDGQETKDNDYYFTGCENVPKSSMYGCLTCDAMDAGAMIESLTPGCGQGYSGSLYSVCYGYGYSHEGYYANCRGYEDYCPSAEPTQWVIDAQPHQVGCH